MQRQFSSLRIRNGWHNAGIWRFKHKNLGWIRCCQCNMEQKLMHMFIYTTWQTSHLPLNLSLLQLRGRLCISEGEKKSNEVQRAEPQRGELLMLTRVKIWSTFLHANPWIWTKRLYCCSTTRFLVSPTLFCQGKACFVSNRDLNTLLTAVSSHWFWSFKTVWICNGIKP